MVKTKRVLALVGFLAGLLGILVGLSALFVPKNNMSEFGMEEVTANGILGERENSIDVLVLGDSEAYSSITPMDLWRDKGYTAYVCGTSSQTLDYTLELFIRALENQKPKVVILETDAIYREEIAAAGLGASINQYFAVLTNTRSVGVMGDGRTYDYTLALRSVTTTDFMTADWTRIPYEVLDRISVRIVNEVPHINRIVYDITSKPPATIEWE